MLSPQALVHSARAALGLLAVLVAVLMIGPFQGAERLLMLSDKQAHALAFFGLTLLSFLAAPRLRRNDLALAALALGGAAEIAQAAVGRDGNLADLAADSVGVFLAWAPAYVDSLRRRARGLERRAARQGRRQQGGRSGQARGEAWAKPPFKGGRS